MTGEVLISEPFLVTFSTFFTLSTIKSREKWEKVLKLTNKSNKKWKSKLFTDYYNEKYYTLLLRTTK